MKKGADAFTRTCKEDEKVAHNDRGAGTDDKHGGVAKTTF
jgi:hypothetical protein